MVLEQWLAGDERVADVDRHVTTCQQCATELETIEAPTGSSIGDALAEALAPPAGLAERLESGVTERLTSRQVLDIVADLFGAGLETTRLLLIEQVDERS